jgi:predicted O-linked N-acetylglucosamine transferase (SPINDLY family)
MSTCLPDAPGQDIAAAYDRLRRLPSDAAAWRDLMRLYADRSLWSQAGYAAGQALRCDARAGTEVESLLAGAPPASALDAALRGAPAPELPRWLAQFELSVGAAPRDWLTWLYLARLQELHGQPARAEEALRAAANCEPMAGETWHWMGVWRLAAGDAAGAVAALARLVDLRPLRAGSMLPLGLALLACGNEAAADKAFERAASSRNPRFLGLLADTLLAQNRWRQALALRERLVMAEPRNAQAWLALARLQADLWRSRAAQCSLDAALQLAPGHPDAESVALRLAERLEPMPEYFRRLLALYDGQDAAGRARMAPAVAMTSLYCDDLSAQEVVDLHRRVTRSLEPDVAPLRAMRERGHGQPLRVGYVTGDLHRQHPVNLFMLPVLRRHDRQRVQVHVYHTGRMVDEYTRAARACAANWVEAGSWSDAQLHEAIVADGVDVLVDLAGHTATHRLGVFARRSAAAQVSLLGYPHSTGLAAMDWIVGDAVVSPPEHDALFSERVARLPDCVFCWAPVDDYPLPPARPAGAPPVFGSFNNALKLGGRTVALWSRVLHAVPGATLLLKAPSFEDELVRERFEHLFAAHGIARERLAFRGPTALEDMMREYGDIDVALDPAPYNGGTTTMQALWMGAPVVTLEGDNFVGRMGSSVLRALGRLEWVAADEAGYVRIAAAMAADVEALRRGRGRQRERMAASPLCDIAGYTSALESLYAAAWNKMRR